MSFTKKTTIGMAAAALLATATVGGAALAAEGGLPDKMVWTAYGTGSSGYTQSVAIGNMLKNKFGTTLSVKPGKNDISRMTPLKLGKADYCACGIASYFGFEGVGLFASEAWGPQPIRLLLSASGSYGLGIGTPADANIMSAADLKGKPVAWVRGADALNVPMTAILAFGGLTWDDVEKTEFSGFKASWEALNTGQVVAAFASTVTPLAKKLAASPHGIRWIPMPHDDTAAWDRFQAVAPYFVKTTVTTGAGVSKENPWEGSAYPYPILVGNDDRKADEVYTLVKAISDGYDEFKDNAPGAKGWALANQKIEWVIPYHEGAVRFLKEAGVWSDAAQAHNDALLARQAVIMDAWAAFKAGDAPSDKEEFKTAWLSARKGALEKAGLPAIFE
ncbi:TAXI family TRAP transporter solute-binding subunit [Rhodovibrionaceae bacterium A322]